MESLRKTFSFITGLFLVIFGVIDECPRLGAVTVGLMLMGVFTVPEALAVIRGRSSQD